MSEAICPSCRATIFKVKPVRIPTDPDSGRWQGRIPTAVGFICPACDVLLPLSPTTERDDE